MKNLPLAGFRPVFAFLLLIAFLFGCQKDNLSPADEHSATNNPAFSANFPVTIEEAMALFSRLNLKSSNSLSGDSAYAFLNIDPLWERAFVGHSQSGRG
jgi:hypothetical protein